MGTAVVKIPRDSASNQQICPDDPAVLSTSHFCVTVVSDAPAVSRYLS